MPALWTLSRPSTCPSPWTRLWTSQQARRLECADAAAAAHIALRETCSCSAHCNELLLMPLAFTCQPRLRHVRRHPPVPVCRLPLVPARVQLVRPHWQASHAALCLVHRLGRQRCAQRPASSAMHSPHCRRRYRANTRETALNVPRLVLSIACTTAGSPFCTPNGKLYLMWDEALQASHRPPGHTRHFTRLRGRRAPRTRAHAASPTHPTPTGAAGHGRSGERVAQEEHHPHLGLPHCSRRLQHQQRWLVRPEQQHTGAALRGVLECPDFGARGLLARLCLHPTRLLCACPPIPCILQACPEPSSRERPQHTTGAPPTPHPSGAGRGRACIQECIRLHAWTVLSGALFQRPTPPSLAPAPDECSPSSARSPPGTSGCRRPPPTLTSSRPSRRHTSPTCPSCRPATAPSGGLAPPAHCLHAAPAMLDRPPTWPALQRWQHLSPPGSTLPPCSFVNNVRIKYVDATAGTWDWAWVFDASKRCDVAGAPACPTGQTCTAGGVCAVSRAAGPTAGLLYVGGTALERSGSAAAPAPLQKECEATETCTPAGLFDATSTCGCPLSAPNCGKNEAGELRCQARPPTAHTPAVLLTPARSCVDACSAPVLNGPNPCALLIVLRTTATSTTARTASARPAASARASRARACSTRNAGCVP